MTLTVRILSGFAALTLTAPIAAAEEPVVPNKPAPTVKRPLPGPPNAPGRAAPALQLPEAPEPCRRVSERLATVFDAVVEPLITEANKREDASAEAGQAAFEAALAAASAEIVAARAEAKAIDATLTAEQRKSCEDYAYRRFARANARFAPAAGFFSGRGNIFRAIGAAFTR
jgi:hypothetical protein